MKLMVALIGHHHYILDARDAILLLDIASRAIMVERSYPNPYRQAAEQWPFIESAELADYEPLAVPADPTDIPF